MSEYRLRDIPVGSMGRIVAIRPTHRSYRSKLLSMGLTRGTAVLVQRVAPLGDPILITVRGFDLSLRKDEADALVLEPVEGDPEEHGFTNAPRRGRRRKNGRGPGPHGAGRGRGRGPHRGRGTPRGHKGGRNE